MGPSAQMCSTWRMSTASLRGENERLKALLAQAQAALSEHQAALAKSEEARRRLEVSENYAERSSERSPRSCGQINIICRSKTWRSRKGVLDVAQEKAAAVIRGRSRVGSDQAVNHWQGLTRFLDDGRLELDTNPVENAIRPICLTRKNALFAGHEVGAENWALLASIVASCKLKDVNPVAYIAETLTVNRRPPKAKSTT